MRTMWAWSGPWCPVPVSFQEPRHLPVMSAVGSPAVVVRVAVNARKVARNIKKGVRRFMVGARVGQMEGGSIHLYRREAGWGLKKTPAPKSHLHRRTGFPARLLNDELGSPSYE